MTKAATLPLDPDLVGADAAIRRAAATARKLALQQGIPYVVRSTQHPYALSRFLGFMLADGVENTPMDLSTDIPTGGSILTAQAETEALTSRIANITGIDVTDIRICIEAGYMITVETASSKGKDRARIATEHLLDKISRKGASISDARKLLVGITASETTFTVDELYEVMHALQPSCAKNASVSIGHVFDATMDGDLRITLLAAGGSMISNARKNGTTD